MKLRRVLARRVAVSAGYDRSIATDRWRLARFTSMALTVRRDSMPLPPSRR